MYYTACLLLTIQWQLLCQAIVSLVYKWEGLLKIVWGGCNPLNPPPPRSAPELCRSSYILRLVSVGSCKQNYGALDQHRLKLANLTVDSQDLPGLAIAKEVKEDDSIKGALHNLSPDISIMLSSTGRGWIPRPLTIHTLCWNT